MDCDGTCPRHVARRHARQERPVAARKAIPLMTRLCEVIHTAHEHGIVHQDIKPGNVMVIARAGAMFPKLLDLGIASELNRAIGLETKVSSLHSSGELPLPPMTASLKRSTSVGTPLYMAPEQWVPGAPITTQTDVYSLSVMAYELLTGKTPFSGNTVLELAVAHARKKPPELPEALHLFQDVLHKAMAKRPKDRYASAVEFGNALRDASGLSIDAVNLPSVDPITRDEVLVGAPQPVAESVAALDAARTPAQLRAALWQTTTTLTQFTGALAIALRQRTSGRHSDAPVVAELFRELSTGTLTAEQWWTLAKELMRPFAKAPALCPMPELVELFFERGSELKTAMDALLTARATDPGAKATAEEIRTYLVGAMAIMGQVLRALKFLHDYTVAVADAGSVESWMGLRRPQRSSVETLGDVPAGAVVIDRNGGFVCALGPAIECAEPSPGAPRELFLLIGATAGKARMMASPHPLEIRRSGVWEQLGISTDAAQAAAQAARGDESPYMGLSTFSANDASRYFGREAEVLSFINRMNERPFIAVVGPSGSGKSSFIQAGVVPNMREPRTVVLMRPGADPFGALAFALGNVGVAVTRDEAGDLAVILSRLSARVDAPMPLLIVDQFEELVTLCADEAEQQRFAELLLALAASGQAAVITTLRDDFLIRIAQIQALRDRLSGSLHLLTTPTEDDLRRILTEPARQVGFEFEDDELVSEITREVSHQSAALALLSFTAYQLWQFRDKHFRRLSRKAYHELGGVGGAMAYHAESVMAELTEAERPVVREIFRHLVTADGTRAILSRPELLQVSGGDAAAPVLEKLVTARLLVAQEGAGGTERIEVIHEAILEAWPRLVKWRREDAEGARLRDQLRAAAKQWHERGRPRGLLWRDEALAEYQMWRARYPGAVTTVENDFGVASVALDKRTRRIKRALLATAITALVIGLIVLFQANRRTEAQRQKTQAMLDAARYEKGRDLAVQGNWREAAKSWVQYLDSKPMDAGIRFMASRALAESQRVIWATDSAVSDSAVTFIKRAEIGLVAGFENGSVAVLDATTGLTRWTARPYTEPVFDAQVIDGAIYSQYGAGIAKFSNDGKPLEAGLAGTGLTSCASSLVTLNDAAESTIVTTRMPSGEEVSVDVGEFINNIDCIGGNNLILGNGHGPNQLRNGKLVPLSSHQHNGALQYAVSGNGAYFAAAYRMPNDIEVFDGHTLKSLALFKGSCQPPNSFVAQCGRAFPVFG
ncbi:MAG: protein kinase [Myxococcales bacterium]|nr:protein kinase [Myxococcales bacterium]